jgi:hypothetical protein
MMRIRTLLITTAITLAVPLAAGAQSVSTSGTKCGPVSWSTDKMAYSAAPCNAEAVGTGGPTARQATTAGSQSSSMTKAEMKQGMQPGYAPTPQGYAPMPMQQAQAVSMGPSPSMASPNMAPMGDQCGPTNAAAIKDEYGRKYNCRGDRIR